MTPSEEQQVLQIIVGLFCFLSVIAILMAVLLAVYPHDSKIVPKPFIARLRHYLWWAGWRASAVYLIFVALSLLALVIRAARLTQ